MVFAATDFVDKDLLKNFAILLSKGRMAHAYLLIGPDASGKSETAVEIAKLVNCEENADFKSTEPCGSCASCVRIASGNHPDVFVLDKGGHLSIKVSEIREIIGKVQLRPYEGRKKVFVIKGIDDLTIEGSNALLKTLEEPTDSCLLLLTTSKPERCLGTVKSRCHAIKFFPVPREAIRQVLKGKASEGQAHVLSFFADGCPSKAQQLFDEEFCDFKNERINSFILERPDDAYVKSLLAEKDQLKATCDVLLSWFRDLLLLKSGAANGNVMNQDRINELAHRVSDYSFEELDDILKGIVQTAKMVDANLNVKIPLTILGEKIWKESYR